MIKNILLSVKDIERAKKELTKLRDKLPAMKEDFVLKSMNEIRNRANAYIQNLDIGEKVKAELMSSWIIEKSLTVYRLTNTQEQACYIEFGTGVVGQQTPHPQAGYVNYKYNVPSDYKSPIDGSWSFFVNKDELDIPRNALVGTHYFNERDRERTRLIATTRGAVGAMFLYKAFMDFLESRQAEVIWQNIKIKAFG